MRAIISVSDKDGIAELGKGLESLGWDVFSTGGTERALRESGIAVQSVSDITNFPEIMDGRVKTLHPQVHGGILARRGNPNDERQMAEHDIQAIDLVAVNLYPFRDAVADPNISLDNALEEIDIGGPTLLRAAAKNFPNVLVLVDAADYAPTLDLLRNGGVPLEERQRLAQKAFQHVAVYDSIIAEYLEQSDGLPLPQELPLGFRKLHGMSYGENPHQSAAFYAEARKSYGLAELEQLQGPELSFNNILDADAAWRTVVDFDAPTVSVIKHSLPCGLASHKDLAEAYRRAFAGDPVSAYGGILGFNRPVTRAAAEELRPVLYHVIVAPDYEPEALEILHRKRQNLRVLKVPVPSKDSMPRWDIRRVFGGVLVQGPDYLEEDPAAWKTVTERAPTSRELYDLAFAWRAVKHVRSNAIVVARDNSILGMGAGQPNRVTSIELAIKAAGDRSKDSVLASDAFMPFGDNIEVAAAGGVTAVVQPGGSLRDEECIQAANAAGIAMVFTGTRHFRH